MPEAGEERDAATHRHQQFATTHWSVVLTAGDDGTSRGRQALETLCQTYWPPIYRYLRWVGYTPPDAQDLTQDYFALLLRKNLPGRADPEKGQFRSFLLHTLKQFVADQHAKSRAKKRGGNYAFVPLDVEVEEGRGLFDAAPNVSPERAFEQRWIQVVLDRVEGQLQQEYATGGRSELFGYLRSFLPGEQPEQSYAEVAKQLNLSLPAVKSAICRLRQRHGELLRDEIAQTVSDPDEIDQEIHSLISYWSR